MGMLEGIKDEFRKYHLGVVATTLCVIFGTMLAFLAAVFDAATSFGGATGLRFFLVFILCLPIAIFFTYVSVMDIKMRYMKQREPDYVPPSMTNRNVIIWLVIIGILGLLKLFFGDSSIVGP
ncbi:MAG: hypothetical protein QOG54_354 [Actinomycetota bacterium]|jgi:hypothetical protein|nr:hypothetical protein [Actinomycetota bacterium]